MICFVNLSRLVEALTRELERIKSPMRPTDRRVACTRFTP